MGNKPEFRQLQDWWLSAIREGLEGRGRFHFMKFNLVYWASVLYKYPYNKNLKDKKNPLYLKEPYIKETKTNTSSQNSDRRKRVRDQINEQLDKIFLEDDGSLNFSHITDFIIRHFLKDLDAYYSDLPDENGNYAREMICRELAETLYKNRRKKIFLIAHSMGSIIAWDVLTKYVPHVKIHTLVTIGSPLGIPIVRGRIITDMKKILPDYPAPGTPDNIQKNWYNLSDFKDRVAMSYDLDDDYLPNKREIRPQDILVHNNYQYNGEDNYHKSYGYLRCPEMANIIADFYRSPNIFNKIVLRRE